MPRGAKKDTAVTKLLFRNGLFLDRRSFVSLHGNEPHLFLKGEDVSAQRLRVWYRSKNRCAICKKEFVFEYYDEWEMDHKQGGLVGRCDCLHNLRIVCPECHRKKHIHPQFTPKQQTQEAADEHDEHGTGNKAD